ncbi:MAG: deoxyribonuclease IV [Christensenellales bacterium]
MLKIGCHLSAAKGFLAMGKEAVSINASTFQFFTRNPRGSKAKDINIDDVAEFTKLASAYDLFPVLAHAPYTLNACSAEARTREFAWEVMADDLMRMEYTPHNMYTFHPGSHVGQGAATGMDLITDLLNGILTPEMTTTVLLETMSGKGSEVGGTFEEIQQIIGGVALQDKLGVCLDTCHVYDAGYDIVKNLDGVLEQFDQVIGLKRLRAVHLNDSMNPMASHKDRHQKIGQGALGLKTMERIINHPLLRKLPFYLETPNEVEGYAEEIRILRGLYKE